jgi:hypothetical protein
VRRLAEISVYAFFCAAARKSTIDVHCGRTRRRIRSVGGGSDQGRRSMRYLHMILGAGLLLGAGLFVGSGPAAAAMPGLLDRSAVADSPVEKVGYYYRRRGYGYRPYYGYGYRRPYYGYRAPYYSYGYRRPYYGYGYGRRWRY